MANDVIAFKVETEKIFMESTIFLNILMGKSVPFLANVVAGSNWWNLMTNAQLFLIIEDIFGKKWWHQQIKYYADIEAED